MCGGVYDTGCGHCRPLGRKARLGLKDRRKCAAISVALGSRWRRRRAGLQDEKVSDCPAVISQLIGGGLAFSLRLIELHTFSGPFFTSRPGVSRPGLRSDPRQTIVFTRVGPSEGGSTEAAIRVASVWSGLAYPFGVPCIDVSLEPTSLRTTFLEKHKRFERLGANRGLKRGEAWAQQKGFEEKKRK